MRRRQSRRSRPERASRPAIRSSATNDLVTPEMDTSDASSISLSFWCRINDIDADDNANNDDLNFKGLTEHHAGT